MTPNTDNATHPDPQRFPFVTVAAAVGVLFVFLGLMWLATRKENPLDAPQPDAADSKTAEPKPDPAARLEEVKARNRAALDGVGAKMSLRDAHDKLLATLKGPNDKMPFPTPEPAAKKDDKKDGKEK